MLSDGDSENVATSAEMILSKTADLLDLTGYTRDIADMIGSQHVPQQRHDLTRLVDQEVETLRQQYPHADFDLDLPQGQFVLAAPKLDVALDHVLTNAVAHNNSDQPQVDVTVRPPETTDGYAKICVVDNGPGIPTQEREVLLEGTEAPLKHGSGLGLWLVNWIVNRSGGYIAFDDNEPRGSQVTLALPVTLSGQQ
jgi:signal transduction histidine kinase